MKKNNTVIGSAVLVMAVMLGSKVLGFLRQVVIAATYGSNIKTDIYFVSSEFMIGLAGALLASLTTALITIYIDTAIKKSQKDANNIASKMLTLFLSAGVGFIILINIFAPVIAKILAPKYDEFALTELTKYLRLFSITFIFTSFQSIYAAVLNANNSFVPGKLYGIVYNPIAIGMVILFARRLDINALIYAYFIGNILQTLLLRFLCKSTFKFKPSVDFKDENIKHLIMLSIPLLLSNIFIQLNNIIDKAICSYLGEGFASNYSYAFTLEQFVTATITYTISLILLSRYATYVAENNTRMLIKSFKEALSGLIVLLAPITVIACVLSFDIAKIVYLRGEFTEAAALQTSHALIGFAIGFCLVAIREMYIRLHLSYQNTKMPMLSNIASVILNAALSFILAKFMGIFGISLATSLSAILAIVMLNRSVKAYIPNFKLTSILKLILKVSFSCVVMIATAFLLKNTFSSFGIIIRFLITALSSFIVYIICLILLKCDELTTLIKNIISAVPKK